MQKNDINTEATETKLENQENNSNNNKEIEKENIDIKNVNQNDIDINKETLEKEEETNKEEKDNTDSNNDLEKENKLVLNKKNNKKKIKLTLFTMLYIICFSLLVSFLFNIHTKQQFDIFYKNTLETIEKTENHYNKYIPKLNQYVYKTNKEHNEEIEERIRIEEERIAKEKAELEAQKEAERQRQLQASRQSQVTSQAQASSTPTNNLPYNPTNAEPEYNQRYARISIPGIGLYSTIVYGDDQSQIDSNDICQRNNIHHFGELGAKIIMGHNDRSLGKLFNSAPGMQIYFNTGFGDFTYVIDSVTRGVTDGWTIRDDNGNEIIHFYEPDADVIYFYTCIGYAGTDKRLVVKCHRI